ncbi:MAG: type II toxin-antitoxin system HicB family antitoxin [Chloroflexota bacterium]|nr:type II toxin-antitoxin system HicB family antitoxin [Chloroflexota bacterium]
MTRHSRYSIVLTPEPDSSAYNVTVPTLPGCFTWGETVSEAITNAREAIEGHIAALVETGQPVPVEGAPSLLRTVEIVLPAGATIEEEPAPVVIRVVRANAVVASRPQAAAETIAKGLVALGA